MSFEAYLDNIKAKTGKTPHGFRRAAREAGLLSREPLRRRSSHGLRGTMTWGGGTPWRYLRCSNRRAGSRPPRKLENSQLCPPLTSVSPGVFTQDFRVRPRTCSPRP